MLKKKIKKLDEKIQGLNLTRNFYKIQINSMYSYYSTDQGTWMDKLYDINIQIYKLEKQKERLQKINNLNENMDSK